MLTSFFSNSKPIQYFLLSALFVIGYFMLVYFVYLSGTGMRSLWEYFFIAGLGVFLLLLLDFIIRKNGITQPNTYALFFFTFGLLLVLDNHTTPQEMLTLLFVLLALRRIISIKSSKNIEKKILDASLYLSIASYFEFWVLLLFVFLYAAIFQKNDTNWRLYFIPIVGFFVFIVLYTTGFLILQKPEVPFYIWTGTFDVHLPIFDNHKSLWGPSIILTSLLLAIGSRLVTLGMLQKKEKKTAYLVILYALISFCIYLLSASTQVALILVIPVCAILLANAIEAKGSTLKGVSFWVKEVLLWCWLVLPFVLWDVQ